MQLAPLRLTLLVSFAALACNQATQAPTAPAAPAEEPHVAAPAPAVTVAAVKIIRLEKLGLRLDGTRDCVVKENGDKQIVRCQKMSVEVAAATRADPKNFEQAKKAERMHDHLGIIKEEKTEDGWNIQFHSSDAGAEMYFAWVRRNIGGKQYECQSTGTDPDEAATAAKACLGLAAL